MMMGPIVAAGLLPAAQAPISLTQILRSVRTHLEMDVSFISEFCHGRRVFRQVESAEGKECIAVGGSDLLEESYCQRVVDGRLPQLIHDPMAHPAARELPVTELLPVGAHVSIPIVLSNGRIYGTFCCFSFQANHSLTERDLQIMRVFAELAADHIEAASEGEMRRQASAACITGVIERDSLTTVYQPIYELAENRVVGVECLARFPDNQSRPPNEWFAEAAEVGLGIELELTAVRAALRSLAYLPSDVYLAINVSPETILSGRLEGSLRGVPSGCIVLEVTEHAIVRDYPGLQKALQPLRSHMRIAVDDAGAGYSGLRHILDIKPDLIKLDMSITRGVERDPARSALATALVTFAKTIGSKIIAEGVETLAELDALRRVGVDCAQGYFLRKPMPIAAAAQFLTARSSGHSPETSPSSPARQLDCSSRFKS